MTRLLAYLAVITCILLAPKPPEIERISVQPEGVSIELGTVAYDYLQPQQALDVLEPYTDSECIEALMKADKTLSYEQADSILFTLQPIH